MPSGGLSKEAAIAHDAWVKPGTLRLWRDEGVDKYVILTCSVRMFLSGA